MGRLNTTHEVRQMRSGRSILLLTVGLVLAVCVGPIALAQSDLPAPTGDDQLGEQYLGAYHGGDIDSVSLTSGTLSLKFPFLSYPQRGKLHLGFSLMYNNQPQHYALHAITHENPFYQWGYFPYQNPLPVEKGDVFVGWDEQVAVTFRGYDNVTGPPKNPVNNYYANYMLQLADGSEHTLANMGGTSTNTLGTNSYSLTSDGPFETLDATAWQVLGPYQAGMLQYGQEPLTALSVIDPDGLMYSPGEEDPNGNFITNSGTALTDSIGRSIPLPPTYNSTSNTSDGGCPTVNGVAPSFAVAWTVPTFGGTTTYTFCYGNVYINIPSNTVDNISVAFGAGGGTTVKLTSILLPNGQNWQFAYNDPDGTNFNGSPVNFATLSQVTLPTGGTISYTYTYEGATATCQNGGRWVSTRTVTDESGSHPWNYQYYGTYTVVTDPMGNDVVHTFGYSNQCALYETQTQYYQGSHTSGTLLKTVNTAYSGSTNVLNTGWGFANVVPTSIATVWPNGQTTTTTKQYDAGYGFTDYMGYTSPVPVIYGKVVSETVTDYTGSVLKTTNTQYLGLTNSNYLSNNIINPPYTVQVKDGGGTQRALTTYNYDQYGLAASNVSLQLNTSPPTGNYRGNLTSITRWVNSGGPNLTTTHYFLNSGEVNLSQDPAGNQTQYVFASAAPYYGAYLTQITNALSQSTEYDYETNSGKLTKITDPNQNTSTYTYDDLFRPIKAKYPDNGQVTATYNDSTFPYSVTRVQLVSGNYPLQHKTVVDYLGRVNQTQFFDPEGIDYVNTAYDAMGRKASVSNPERSGSSPTDGTTSYVYDGLGRVCVEIPPDGTTVSSCPSAQPAGDTFTVYTGNATSVYDEAGHGRKTVTDALGRITQVFEAPDSLDYETDYSYDALNNLTAVTQKGSNSSLARTRSFSYDSLSRLISSTNPETGNILYYYLTPTSALCSGAPENLCWKAAPAANQTGSGTTTTSYSYDALNRLTGRTYSDGTGSDVFVYDSSSQWGASLTNTVGRLVRASTNNANIGNVFSYDKMGRKSTVYNVVWSGGNVYSNIFNYTYNLDGSLATMTYPSDTSLTYSQEQGVCGNGIYCTSGRVVSIVDTVNNINYLGGQSNSVQYAPPGELTNALHGYNSGAGFNGYTVTNSYNTRLQPYNLSVNSTSPSATILSLSYNFNLGGDNGNVAGITNLLDNTSYHPGVGSVTYTYDALNRITSAQTTGSDCTTLPNTGGLTTNWGESYTVDSWGNMTTAAVTKCSAVPLSVTVNTSNQFANACYDSAGNLLTGSSCGSPVYTYNGKNQLVATAGYTYTYDAEGDRAIKASGSTGTIYARSFGSDTLYETNLSGAFQNEYIFFNGKRLARRDASGNQHYYFTDMLGSSSVTANQSGAVENVEDFYPYGLSRQLITNSAQNYQFTGKERDPESNLDDFGARYYSSYWSRFMTPDWAEKIEPVPYAKLENPQSLNLYSYTLNNPVVHIDADGHIIDDNKLRKNRQYQKWKAEYLSHAGARAQWNALNENKDITVHVGWDNKANSSVTDGYVWNKSGTLTSVNVTLAAKTGSVENGMQSENGYIHGSQITNDPLRQAYVVAHEFAHVEYAQTAAGAATLQQDDKDGQRLQELHHRYSLSEYEKLPEAGAISQRLDQDHYTREKGADQRAWDVLGDPKP